MEEIFPFFYRTVRDSLVITSQLVMQLLVTCFDFQIERTIDTIDQVPPGCIGDCEDSCFFVFSPSP